MKYNKKEWIERKIAEKNTRKARLPVLETNLGKSMIGDCEAEWIVRERTKNGKPSKFVQKILRKANEMHLL
jgi:hypothetical protein